MVYAYCRKDDNHSVQSIEDWAENNSIVIDEFVWDDDAKQKDSYDKRKLGLFLFPKVQKGDILIVSEISCIGRSAIELQRIIDTVFTIKRIRLVCLSINMDVDFANITASESNLLEKFYFAAKLQKVIIHETTKAALAAKRNKGVKMGAASEKYKKHLESKSQEELEYVQIKRRLAKNIKNIEKAETQAFIKILREVFNLDEDGSKWNWDIVSTKGDYKNQIIQAMEEFQKTEGVYDKWDFSNYNDRRLHGRLCAYINSVRRSLTTYYSNIRYGEMTLEEYINYKSSTKKLSKEVVRDPQLAKRKRRRSKNYESHTEVTIDTVQLGKIEEETKESQRILSDIFVETNSNEDYNIKVSSPIMDILKVLFTKDVWSYEAVDILCKKRKLMIGSVLEQINDYALETVDDIIIEDDGENIYIMTEYKDLLI